MSFSKDGVFVKWDVKFVGGVVWRRLGVWFWLCLVWDVCYRGRGWVGSGLWVRSLGKKFGLEIKFGYFADGWDILDI